MTRRESIAAMLGVGASRAWAQKGVPGIVGTIPGTAVAVDVASGRVLGVYRAQVAGQVVALPGSTLKPFVLAELLRVGKLGARETFPCPGDLTIGWRSFACTHPKVATIEVATALAYSCNCFVAHCAERFAPGELAAELLRLGMSARTGWFDDEAAGTIAPAYGRDAQRLQALGESGVMVTAAELAMAYRRLAQRIDAPEMNPIRAGLEGAVEFGTAQRARTAGTTVAGKTGSAQTEEGTPIAWFAGFAPSRAPKVVVAVMLQGHSGGADAAPVAGRLFEGWLAGRL